MLYKMHLCREELAIIDAAMKDYIMLHEEQQEATESAAQKIALLKDYVELCAEVQQAVSKKEKAKQAYDNYTFKRAPFPWDELPS